MKKLFNVSFEEDALKFIESLDDKVAEKVFRVIEMAQFEHNPKMFTKLNKHIWEFRIKFLKREFRLLAFWSPNEKSLVICTHGFEKKSQKTPKGQIIKAENKRKEYLNR